MPGAALIIPAGKYLDATQNGITWDNLDSYLSMGEGSRIIVEEGAELRLPPNDTGNKFPSLCVSGNGIVKIGDHALFRLECWDGETLLSTGYVKEDNTVTEPDAPIKEGCTFQGWYPEPEGGEPVDFSKPIDADMALYARWTVNMAIQEGDSVSAKGSITYGQPLSELEFYPTCFVEEGTGDKVAGVLSWKNPADIPKAGEFSAEWVFTPEDSVKYMGMEGTAAVTVEKADPYISSLPAALQIMYGDTLGSSALTGGKVQHKCPASAARVNAPTSANGIGQGGSPANIATARANAPTSANAIGQGGSPANIPAVSGGAAQPGSLDGVPMAFMDDSALPDSTAKPSSLDGDAVEGSFSWKDSDIKPTVADSNKTAYAIIFTPSDMENYNCVEAAVKLEVEPAEHAPNMPSKTMDVPNSCQKAGDIALPEGWQWLEPDTALLPGVSTKATAIYVEAGKGNYKEESAEITITRAICPHRTTKTINAKTATCVAEGYSGDILCTNCGATLETGKAIQPFGHSPNAIVVKQPTKAETGIREYRCTVCGILLQTEIIPKLTQAGATPEPPQEGTTPKLPESQGKVTKVQKEKNAYLLSAGLKATQSGRSITITWGRVKDADGYGIYIQYCGQKYSPKSCYTAKGGKNTKLTVQKINGKKLDLKKSYRIYVAAYKQSNGKKITLGKSITFHFSAKSSKK